MKDKEMEALKYTAYHDKAAYGSTRPPPPKKKGRREEERIAVCDLLPMFIKTKLDVTALAIFSTV